MLPDLRSLHVREEEEEGEKERKELISNEEEKKKGGQKSRREILFPEMHFGGASVIVSVMSASCWRDLTHMRMRM